MIQGKKVLGIIPARGGSKGVLGKNIRAVAGKPLIAWTIEEAKKSKIIDRLILSSEDDEIIRVAKEWGCEVPFVRPLELASDETPGIDPILHAIEVLPEAYDYVVVLQPTSPLRKSSDIDNCVHLCDEVNAPSCVSMTEVDKSPYWMYVISCNGQITSIIDQEKPFSRRQELPKFHVLNGAIYVAKTAWLIKSNKFVGSGTVAYVMTQRASLDIDTELDIELADFLLSHL